VLSLATDIMRGIGRRCGALDTTCQNVDERDWLSAPSTRAF
jgi:hypothetical protein